MITISFNTLINHLSSLHPTKDSILFFGEVQTIPIDKAYLLTDEQAKASNFYQEKDRRAYIFRHHFINSLIANWLHCDYREVNYTKGIYGKPYLKDNPFYFNISKSSNHFCAIVSPFEIGVDIEIIKNVNEMKKVANEYFTLEEQIFCNEEKDFNSAFLKIWTRKEAYLKATGSGIIDNMKNINCLLERVNNNSGCIVIETINHNDLVISYATTQTTPISLNLIKVT